MLALANIYPEFNDFIQAASFLYFHLLYVRPVIRYLYMNLFINICDIVSSV